MRQTVVKRENCIESNGNVQIEDWGCNESNSGNESANRCY